MDEVSLIREKIDVVSFIQEFIPLKKAGRNFKANCPFHTEKSPSFMVNPERQIWHCFGCGKGGDIYSFLMDYERLEFPEALRFLAKRAGVELAVRPAQVAQSSKKERIYQINKLVCEYYHFILTQHNAGKKAREYLKNRGLTAKIVATFQLGFAPSAGNALLKYLLEKKHFSIQDILDAGLVSQWSGRNRDFFLGRLIFPLIDHRDNVVGFAGRVLEKNASAAKYINTRETLAYHKGDQVYGLNITKEAVRKANQVIICEGEFDVISCFQHGITNVVGVKGTALTENQVNLLKRFADKLTFCFDGDNPGQEAIKRSLPIVEKKGLTPTVINIPSGKDPDEALQKDAGLFKKAVRHDSPAYDYLMDKLSATHDLNTAEGKKITADTLLPLLSGIQNEIIKEHYLRKMANLLETSYESILKEADRHIVKEKPAVALPVISTPRPKEEIMEEYLLSLIIQSRTPKDALQKAVKILSDTLSKERAYQKILYHLLDHFTSTDSFDGKIFVNKLPAELIPSYDTTLLYPIPHFDDQKKLEAEVENISLKLRTFYIRRKMKDLAAEIKSKEREGKAEAVGELQKKYTTLSSRL